MRDTHGGIIVLVALILVPTILILGLAVDSAVNLEQQRKLQTAVDAAARSGAINGQGSLPTITSEAQKLFTANTIGMSGVTSPAISYDSTTRIVSVSASITVPTMFMKIGDITTKTFNATGTYLSTKLDEVVIFIEVSDRSSTASSYNTTVCNQLINFINSLPTNMLVSIVPVASEIKLDSASTVTSSLFNHLSNTTDDESVNPAHYPLSSSLTWNLSNFNSIDNILYLTNATASTSSYGGISYVGPNLSSYSYAATCPGGYATCPATLYNANCPSTSNMSCTSTYRYSMRTPYAILPLTLNRTLITTYINNLKAWKSTSKAYFPSLISWAWRAIDPAWSDFWLVNLDSTSSTRITEHYPQAYDPKVSKSIVIIAYDQSDWTDYKTLALNFYMKKCGDRVSANADGTLDRQWAVNSYGVLPVLSHLLR